MERVGESDICSQLDSLVLELERLRRQLEVQYGVGIEASDYIQPPSAEATTRYMAQILDSVPKPSEVFKERVRGSLRKVVRYP